VGNRENTYCPSCNELLIKRRGFMVVDNRMNHDSCPSCGTKIPGVWEDHAPKKTNGWGIPLPIFVVNERCG